jgi:hypothetical protein
VFTARSWGLSGSASPCQWIGRAVVASVIGPRFDNLDTSTTLDF